MYPKYRCGRFGAGYLETSTGVVMHNKNTPDDNKTLRSRGGQSTTQRPWHFDVSCSTKWHSEKGTREPSGTGVALVSTYRGWVILWEDCQPPHHPQPPHLLSAKSRPRQRQHRVQTSNNNLTNVQQPSYRQPKSTRCQLVISKCKGCGLQRPQQVRHQKLPQHGDGPRAQRLRQQGRVHYVPRQEGEEGRKVAT